MLPLMRPGLDTWLDDRPDPVGKFIDVFGLQVYLPGSCNVGDESFPAEDGLLEPAKFRHRVLACVAECNEMVVVNDQPFTSSERVLVDGPERIDKEKPGSRNLDHEQSLTEEPLCEALPLDVKVDTRLGGNVRRFLDDITPYGRDVEHVDVAQRCRTERRFSCTARRGKIIDKE